MRAELATFERALIQGPEAILTLREGLSSEALDLVMDEIVAAQEEVSAQVPPPPPSRPVSPEEEGAIVREQQRRDAANRAMALEQRSDPNENQTPESIEPPPASQKPTRPSADLTVGDGCTYATIGEALGAASPGDRLLLEGGRTFTENITVTLSITISGGYDGCASGSPDRTTIDGGANNSVLIIESTLSVNLENLNVTNGSSSGKGGGIEFARGAGTGSLTLNQVSIYSNTATGGGGLWAGSAAEVWGTHVEIYDNSAASYGGGVRLFGASATFTSSNIFSNTAPSGGGVYGSLEMSNAPSLNLPQSADVKDNQALTGDGFGGGLYLREGTVTIDNCSDVYSNESLVGGGAYLVTSTLTIHGHCSEIQYNTASGNGGGVYAQDSTINLDEDASIYYNTAGGSGGGLYLDSSTLWSDKSTLMFNDAATAGGGVYAVNSSRVDLDLGGYQCIGIYCSRLHGNSAGTGYGGGIYASSSSVNLDNTFVQNNSSNRGGGIYAVDSSVYLYNALFSRNSTTSDVGDALRLYTGATLYGAGNTFAYNDTGGADTGQAIDSFSASVTLRCSIIWGHASSINDAAQTITYSDIEGGYAGTGNVDTDPLFVSTTDYHLQMSSPVIDQCSFFTGMNTDFDNEVRPIVHTNSTTPYDMGADEASTPRVGINDSGCLYGTIQQAANAASDGDRLQVAQDTYGENLYISGKSLFIEGDYSSDCTTPGSGPTVINGSYHTSHSVVSFRDGSLTLRNLELTEGSAVTGGGVEIRNARVTLDNTKVHNNTGTYGGGLWINPQSVVTLTNDSDVYNNTATDEGGGAKVWGTLIGAETQSDLYGNTAPHGGGVMVDSGTLILDGSDMRSNSATAADGKGGGVYVIDGGVVRTLNNAWIYGGHTAYDGAGIYADGSTLYLTGGYINESQAERAGGGIYLTNGSHLETNSAWLGYEALATTGNQAERGGGLYVLTSTVEFRSGGIANNLGLDRGGGIYASASAITLTDTQVGGTELNQANQLGPDGHLGVGLYLTSGTRAILTNTTVSSNTFQTTDYAYGGGLFIGEGSVVTLTGSTVERHVAPSLSDGRGAGIYVSDSTLTLDTSQILSNTAGAVGGGLRIHNASTVRILNNTLFRNNEALSGAGGGIHAHNSPTLWVSDAIFRDNRAATDGGAIHQSSGTLDFTGAWTLRSNEAGGHGGAIAVTGSADADFYASAYSLVYNNRAGGNGGALYVTSGDAVDLHTVDGPIIYVYANESDAGGGFFYAAGDTSLNVLGQVRVDHNWSTLGSGGAFYLRGSALSLTASPAGAPDLWDNRTYAGNGGAIYAAEGSRVSCAGASLGLADDGNQADNDGGAIYLSGSVLTSTNCALVDNLTVNNGGAIAAYTSTVTVGADFAACFSGDRCSEVYSNTADSDLDSVGYGGAIYANDSTLRVNHTYLHRNVADRGGAIYQAGTGARAWLADTLIYSNTANTSFGAGIRVQSGAFTLTHVTLANNVNGAGYSQGAVASSWISNSVAWANELGGFLGSFVATSCNVDQQGNAGTYADPRFVAPGVGEDYHLQGNSPAIDLCPTGFPHDLDNVVRPFGSGYDAGAYEYVYGVAFAPDRAGSGIAPGVVLYTHHLTNTGGTTDTFALTASSDQGWDVALSPAPSVTLSSGASGPVTVSITIPDGVLSGTVDTTVVTATSTHDPALTAQVTDTTTAFTTTQPLYVLTVHVVGNGGVTRSPSQTAYVSGTVVQLHAMPDAGWAFSEWSGDLTGATNPDSITLDGDKVVTATFVPRYSLTVNTVGSGSVVVTPDQADYVSGTVVQLEAQPDPGWYFTGWSGDLTTANNPIDLLMDGDKVVTATFSAAPPPTYTLDVNVVGSGSVVVTPSQTSYVSGTAVSLEAVPDAGWIFSGWSGDLTTANNPIDLLMDGDKVVTATFTSGCTPISGADFTFTPAAPRVGEPATFTGTIAAGSAPVYAWDFGDGSAGSGAALVHTFPVTATAQTYTVVMTVSNSCPSQSVVTHTVTVRPYTLYLPLTLKGGTTTRAR